MGRAGNQDKTASSLHETRADADLQRFLDGYIAECGPWLYHHSPKAADFAEHGLRPSSDTGELRFDKGRETARRDVVYMGDFSVVSSQYGWNENEVLMIDLRKLDPQLMHPDARIFFWTLFTDEGEAIVEDFTGEGLEDPESTTGPGLKYATYGDWSVANLSARRQHWVEQSLDIEGALAYAGAIDASACQLLPTGHKPYER